MAQPSAVMQGPRPAKKNRYAFLESNTYSIFILILTIYSLLIMAIQMLLPKDSETFKLVSTYDNLVCLIFLFDFFSHLFSAPNKRHYFFKEGGIFDLLGSIPSFGFSQYAVLLRLFRLSRLFRLRRLLNPQNRELLKNEILNNRGSYALFITAMLIAIVLTLSSIFVLMFESQSPDANIQNGGNALWWAVVTITTVGYGDRFPVTAGGRIVAVVVMFAGVGIIGALASILASILVPQPKEEPKDPESPTVQQELAALRQELSELRKQLKQ